MNESVHEEKNGTSHYTVQNLTGDILYNSCYENQNVWHSELRILGYGSHPIMFIT